VGRIFFSAEFVSRKLGLFNRDVEGCFGELGVGFVLDLLSKRALSVRVPRV
jgi:hypothetical protein